MQIKTAPGRARSKPLSRGQRRLYGAIMAPLVFIALIFSLDEILKLMRFEYIPLRAKLLNRADCHLEQAFQNGDFTSDSTLFWRPRPNRSVFNEQGMRGPVFSFEKPPGEIRILAIGDSNTLGCDGTDGPNWPLYLGAMLKQANTNIVLVNAGVWGYSSFQGLQKFRQCLIYQPDLVLWSFGANDGHIIGAPDRAHASTGARRRRIAQRMMRSRLGQLALKTLDSLAAATGGGKPAPRVPPAEYRANLDEVIRVCRELDIGIMALTRPFAERSSAPTRLKAGTPEYNQATIDAAIEAGVPMADVYDWFKDHSDMLTDESLFTEAGHRRAAALLFEVIQKNRQNLFGRP